MRRATTKIWFWLLLAALIVLHQDYWQQLDATLLFGFLPRGLAYQAALSLLAAAFWLWAVNDCWPLDWDQIEAPADDQGPAS